MLNRVGMAIAVIAGFISVAVAAGLTDVQITFQTTECNGDTGFASVELERIWRIKAADCSTPDNPDDKLFQVLVKSHSGLTNYEVFTVNTAEAESIQAQIKAHMEAKRKALEGGDTVIIEH